MNLIDLISYFRQGVDQNKFFKDNSLDLDSEVVEIFMEKPLSVQNELKFFEIEKTEGKNQFEFQSINYYNLIDFYFFNDFIEESKTGTNEKLTDKELAEVLLNYCINDA